VIASLIIRKGAISAKKGELVIIPFLMAKGLFWAGVKEMTHETIQRPMSLKKKSARMR